MKRERVFVVLALLSVAALALTGCGGSQDDQSVASSSTNVRLVDRAFDPELLEAATGDRVTFTNDDSETHHVVVGSDDLGELQPGEAAIWKAGLPGTYIMKCLIHPEMRGQVTVFPAGGGSGGATGGAVPPMGNAPGGTMGNSPGAGGSMGGTGSPGSTGPMGPGSMTGTATVP